MNAARQIIETARKMNALGINRGTSGNVSARREDGQGILITPSGVEYDVIEEPDIVSMDWDGTWRCARDARKPSSEWRFHLDILKARKEFGGVVHAHPVHATALAVHGRGIGAFHYMVAIAGGKDIRCAPYATFGTQALSDSVLEALKDRKACLMAHHGLVACGRDLAQALEIAVEVDTLAAQYLVALAIGEPPTLPDAEMDEVLRRFDAGYGYGASE
jgi:L-fuculose-phosphate aldolase